MLGRVIYGVRTPIIREGDDLLKLIPDSIFKSIELHSGDIIGITESIVARAQGNYVTIDEVSEEIKRLNKDNLPIRLFFPIYSRNRFSMILKAFARATKEIELIMPDIDEVGNVRENHPFTGLDYSKLYIDICNKEGCQCYIFKSVAYNKIKGWFNVDCSLRPFMEFTTLADICKDKCEWGLLGSNKASEEKLKLFPNKAKAQLLVDSLQQKLAAQGINVEVMIYGDGCFKDPVGGIWEFADPVTSPAYTKGLEGTPNEIKLKAFADDQFANLTGLDLENAIKGAIKSKPVDMTASMSSQGTTPRRKVDLLASLMDLVSGSGDMGTPVIVVRGYENNYAYETT